ncbi:hypothetical protein D0Y65_029966, partial [Glycine soja]
SFFSVFPYSSAMPFLLLSCFFRRCCHRSQSLVSIVTQSWFVLDFSFVVIIVRIRGLGWTLSRVIGRALCRKVSRDADEGPKRRRPTTSAHRQRKAAPAHVVEDVEHVDHVSKELPSYGKKVEKFGRLAPKIEGLVTATRLSHLIACSMDTGDRGLMLSFAERWHKETSSFHLPVAEVTITLDDVALLLHLSNTSVFHSFEDVHVDDVVFLLVELLEIESTSIFLQLFLLLLLKIMMRGNHVLVVESLGRHYQCRHITGDLPRHPPTVRDDTFVEAYVPQQPVAATTMDKALADAHADAEQPQHTASKNFRDLVDDGNQFNGLFYIEREDAQFGDDAWEALLPLEPDVAVVEAKELEDNRDLIDDFFLREGIGV